MAEKKSSKKSVKKTVSKKTAAIKKPTKTKAKKTPGFLKPFLSLGGYFKGAWQELTQVRWPNRRATWSLTVAVLIFTGFFTAMIVALDTGFEYILNRILL